MIYQHKNITIHIRTDINIGDDIGDVKESLGWCNYSYPEKTLKAFIKEQKSDETRCVYAVEDERIDYDADFFISFVDWFDYTYSRKKIEIEVTAQHPFWVFHDLCHAEERDVIGCEGDVTAWIERDRLQRGFELMTENGGPELENYYKEYIRDAFYDRFKEHLQLEEFEEVYEDEEEYEEDYY